MAKAMTAKYAGKCAKCSVWMPVGTLIMYDPNQPSHLKVWHQTCDGLAAIAAPSAPEPKDETMPVQKDVIMVKARIAELMEQNTNLITERDMYHACKMAGDLDNSQSADIHYAQIEIAERVTKNANEINALTVPQKWDLVKVTGHVKEVSLQQKNMIVIWAGLGKFGPRVCVKESLYDVSKHYLDPKSVTVVQRPIF
jgi:hypothetical protein